MCSPVPMNTTKNDDGGPAFAQPTRFGPEYDKTSAEVLGEQVLLVATSGHYSPTYLREREARQLAANLIGAADAMLATRTRDGRGCGMIGLLRMPIELLDLAKGVAYAAGS